MTRTLLIALALAALAACQPEKKGETAKEAAATEMEALGKKPSLDASLPEGKDKGQKSQPETATAPNAQRSKAAGAETGSDRPSAAGQPEKGRSKAAALPAKQQETASENAGSSKHSSFTPDPSTPSPPSHIAWGALLQKHVSPEGKVDYKGFLADKAKLQAYLDELAAHPAEKGWPRNEKLAYWINAYNAFTVKLILDHYPVSSITKIHDGKPWDVKWINLGGKTYSLNNIEHDIIRPGFDEPRIHFAVNCAARSCPPLLNRAWTADNLGRYLGQQARSFINNPQYNEIGQDAVQISRIFEWYAGDFGDIINYLNQYADTKIRQDAQVSYKEYDWALNGQD